MAMSCGVGRRQGSDLAFLWPWCRPAATGAIWPLAWEPPYAAGVALEKRPKKKKKIEWVGGPSHNVQMPSSNSHVCQPYI